ncbi:hypothetical protein B0T26DRAFT_732063 [Lasiosphaeria miniovina]|uniref:Bifunctional inhibitor/plant lipid transfer protein/seed storage helical domain-containing protein n=1 Tax=Lasiosphaeria miniovina TaxID=1954250 RepID=A0AA39ZU91_9PEZI|nr:uncharacterized protein B0T26DRAFT_732063 [Lasiosphaeria miniovina]KAK0703615.1 hypothetical protein B0T26DRAFT_732063 [Lasiosphaeria miniovina]
MALGGSVVCVLLSICVQLVSSTAASQSHPRCSSTEGIHLAAKSKQHSSRSCCAEVLRLVRYKGRIQQGDLALEQLARSPCRC